MYGKKYAIDNINSIQDLENKVFEETKIPPNKQRLLFNGKLVTDLPKNNSILYLVFKLIGG